MQCYDIDPFCSVLSRVVLYCSVMWFDVMFGYVKPCSVIVLWLFCYCSVIVLLLLCSCYVIVMLLFCFCYVIVIVIVMLCLKLY